MLLYQSSSFSCSHADSLTKERMKSKDPRPSPYPDRRVPMTIMLLVFCGFSFYLGGIYFPANKLQKEDVSHALQLEPIEPKAVTPASLQVEPIEFPECECCEDRTPCTDPMVYFLIYTHKKCTLVLFCTMNSLIINLKPSESVLTTSSTPN